MNKNSSKSCSFLEERAKTNNLLYNSSTFDLKNFFINVDLDEKYAKEETQSIEGVLAICHEKYHHLQFFSSTLGLFYCLCNFGRENILRYLLTEEKKCPPLITHIEKDESLEHISELLYLMEYVKLWIEGDFTKNYIESLKREFPYGKITSDQLYNLFQRFGMVLVRFGLKSFELNESDFKLIEEARKIAQESEYEPHPVILDENNKVIGTISILEGAARTVDFLKIDTYKIKYPHSMDILKTLEQKLKEDCQYGLAYKLYKIMVNIEDELWSYCMFLVVCDFAINIPTPPFDYKMVLVYPDSFLPQNRFIQLCLLLKQYLSDGNKIRIVENTEKLNELENNGFVITELEFNSIDDWNKLIVAFYEILENITSFPSPLTLAKEFLSLSENSKEKLDNLNTLDNFMVKYKIACQIRLECPAFICNPELINYLDRNKYLEFSKKLSSSIIMVNNQVRQVQDRKEEWSDIKRYVFIASLNHLFICDKIQISDIMSSVPIKEEDIICMLKELYGDIILDYL